MLFRASLITSVDTSSLQLRSRRFDRWAAVAVVLRIVAAVRRIAVVLHTPAAVLDSPRVAAAHDVALGLGAADNLLHET